MAIGRAKRPIGAVGCMALGIILFSGCAKNFAGPYPCNTGYASCVTTDRCETSTATDPEHCGECGNACPRGATCADGECSAGPPMLSDDVKPETFEMNQDNLFWSGYSSAGVVGYRKQTEASFGVETPDGQPPVGMPFAVDDTELFYQAQFNGNQGTISRIQAVPADSVASPSVRVIVEFPQESPANDVPLVLVGDTLFFSQNVGGGGGGSSLVVRGVPKVGGSITEVASLNSSNGTIVVDSTNVYTTSSNGPCTVEYVSLSGGSPSTLVRDQQRGCPRALASDGERLYWASNYTDYSNNSDDPDNGGGPQYQRCLVEVASISVNGGNVTTRATFVADELPSRIAFDGGVVYLATDRSVWRIPEGEGVPARIAGNLDTPNLSNRGPGSSGCSNMGGGGGGAAPVAIAVDDKNVYVVALRSDNTSGRLFRIAK